MKYFALGFITATAIIVLGIWLGRHQIIKWASVAYESVEKPAILLTDVELRQNGKQIGKVDKGAVVLVKGRAKDSPMEYFSVPLGWENRGVDAKTVYRILPQDDSSMVEMVLPQR
jgi:hypothetical protein